MFRPRSDLDISDKELAKYVNPHERMFDSYLYEYIIPDAVAFYLASGYFNDAIWEGSYDIHINTVLDQLNQVCLSKNIFNCIKKRTTKALKIKYGLIVTNDNPLEFKNRYSSNCKI